MLISIIEDYQPTEQNSYQQQDENEKRPRRKPARQFAVKEGKQIAVHEVIL